MKLDKFVNLFFTDDGYLTVCVFDSEQERDGYRDSGSDGMYLFRVSSCYKMSVFLKEKYANAKVRQVFPVSANEIDVVIEVEDAKDEDG